MGIKQARLNAGKSVSEVAHELGISEAAVYQWEAGDTSPRIEKLVTLARFFGCTVDFLLKEDDSKDGGQ